MNSWSKGFIASMQFEWSAEARERANGKVHAFLLQSHRWSVTVGSATGLGRGLTPGNRLLLSSNSHIPTADAVCNPSLGPITCCEMGRRQQTKKAKPGRNAAMARLSLLSGGPGCSVHCVHPQIWWKLCMAPVKQPAAPDY